MIVPHCVLRKGTYCKKLYLMFDVQTEETKKKEKSKRCEVARENPPSVAGNGTNEQFRRSS